MRKSGKSAFGRTTGALAAGGGILLILPLAGLDPFLLDVLTVGFIYEWKKGALEWE